MSLVAHMHHVEIITPHVSRNYQLKQFKNDLKNVSYPLKKRFLQYGSVGLSTLGFDCVFHSVSGSHKNDLFCTQ